MSNNAISARNANGRCTKIDSNVPVPAATRRPPNTYRTSKLIPTNQDTPTAAIAGTMAYGHNRGPLTGDDVVTGAGRVSTMATRMPAATGAPWWSADVRTVDKT